MKTATQSEFELVLKKLKHYGLLLESDPRLPSVCTLITGVRLSGSWWSHPQAQVIFRVNEQLVDHSDVLITKLISGKVTFVHRQLWSEFLAIGAAREQWQTEGLSPDAQFILRLLDEQGMLRTDKLTWPESAQLSSGAVTRELEKRLLIHSTELHTESGAHAKVIETWQRWANRQGFTTRRISAQHAKRRIEEKVMALNEEFGARARLPWNALQKTKISG